MDVSMLTVALLACPLVFSLIMAALPKTCLLYTSDAADE